MKPVINIDQFSKDISISGNEQRYVSLLNKMLSSHFIVDT